MSLVERSLPSGARNNATESVLAGGLAGVGAGGPSDETAVASGHRVSGSGFREPMETQEEKIQE